MRPLITKLLRISMGKSGTKSFVLAKPEIYMHWPPFAYQREAYCKMISARLRVRFSFPIHYFPSMIIQSLYLFRNSHHHDLGPILLGYDPNSNHLTGSEWTKMPVHDDEEQVKLDVDRSFVHYPNCMDRQNLNLSEK